MSSRGVLGHAAGMQDVLGDPGAEWIQIDADPLDLLALDDLSVLERTSGWPLLASDAGPLLLLAPDVDVVALP